MTRVLCRGCAFALAGAMLMLAGCGQKGPLYLPPKSGAVVTAPATTPAPPPPTTPGQPPQPSPAPQPQSSGEPPPTDIAPLPKKSDKDDKDQDQQTPH
jgi:predicted small lipoprotein YifL